MANPWFYRASPKSAPSMRLFCFPFAGGNASTFHEWDSHLPHSTEVVSIELPGRGSRFGETPIRRADLMIDVLEGPILALADVPVLLFGHSMGALIAFEVARRLQQRTALAAPMALFVSAQIPPMFAQERNGASQLPTVEFLAHLQELNGMPAEILQNRELLDLLMPAIRADFELTEKYRYAPGPRLTCPVTAFCGTRDQGAPASVMTDWRKVTKSDFHLLEVAGDHFFLNTMRRNLLQLLKGEIMRIREPLRK